MALLSGSSWPAPETSRQLPARRRRLAPCSAAFAAAVAALAPSPSFGAISPTGFSSTYYQGFGYNGSRVLEQLEENRYSEYLLVTWTQSVAVDTSGNIWVVDRNNHVLVMMLPSTRYVPWAAFYSDYAGLRGQFDHMDGSRKQSRFNSPTGIAVTLKADQPLTIFISDTNNHCIRRVNYATERVSNIVGLPKVPGLRDGPTKDSRLRLPQSLGLDESGDNLMVLDNGNRVRHVKVNLLVPTITTLVDGACRQISRYTMLTSIEYREVGCHTDWLALDVGDTEVDTHLSRTGCIGHKATCGARNHPALQDIFSPQLIPEPVKTTTTTTKKSMFG
jgi:hypothetical protein